MVKNLHANAEEMQETQVPSLGQEDPLELEMVTRSSIRAWGIPWTKEPDSPWGCRELDMTECQSIHINLIKIRLPTGSRALVTERGMKNIQEFVPLFFLSYFPVNCDFKVLADSCS